MNDGGPAFPLVLPTGFEDSYEYYIGISMRDYFAAKAMAAICGAIFTKLSNIEMDIKDVPFSAYVLADGMIAERKKGTE